MGHSDIYLSMIKWLAKGLNANQPLVGWLDLIDLGRVVRGIGLSKVLIRVTIVQLRLVHRACHSFLSLWSGKLPTLEIGFTHAHQHPATTHNRPVCMITNIYMFYPRCSSFFSLSKKKTKQKGIRGRLGELWHRRRVQLRQVFVLLVLLGGSGDYVSIRMPCLVSFRFVPFRGRLLRLGGALLIPGLWFGRG